MQSAGSVQIASLPLFRAVTEPPGVRGGWQRAIDDVLQAETEAGPDQGMRARRVIEDAVRTGLLTEVVPSVVVHEMAADGVRVRGVLALLSTTLVDDRLVRPHEQTLRSREESLATFQDGCPFDIAPVLVAHRPSPTLEAFVETAIDTDAMLTVEYDGVVHRWWQARRGDIGEFAGMLEGMTVMDGHHRVAAAQRRAATHRAPQPIFSELVNQDALMTHGFHMLVEVADPDATRRVIEGWGSVQEVDDSRVERPTGDEILVRMGGRWLTVVPPASADRSDAALASLAGLWMREALLSRVLDVDTPGDDARALALPGLAPLDRLARIVDGRAPHDPLWPVGHSSATGLAAVVVQAPQSSAIVHAASQGIILPPKSTFVHPKPPPGALIHRREVLTRGG